MGDYDVEEELACGCRKIKQEHGIENYTDNSEKEVSNGTVGSLKKKKMPQLRAKTNNTKMGRLIVRNLSFKERQPTVIFQQDGLCNSNAVQDVEMLRDRITRAVEEVTSVILAMWGMNSTEASVKNHFSPFGEVTEVILLRRPDNKLVGCGFVQFAKKNSAAKAILQVSGKPFLGRPIIVDWAVSKDRFIANKKSNTDKEVKAEHTIGEEDIKEEVVTDAADKETKREAAAGSSEKEEDSEDSDEEVVVEEEKFEPERKRPRVESNDVIEGRTVFIRNVPFSTTNEELKKTLQQFGPTFYALICVDPLTEHSKGTAFVKFKSVESAEKCLSAGTDLKLNGVILDPHKALKREEITEKNQKPKEEKDSRNLYLVKEGMIVAGSKSAVGVSIADMTKRLQLEHWKQQMLRNLNMFVSRFRLVVHNLPPTLTDNKLRIIFKQHAGESAIIKEESLPYSDISSATAKSSVVIESRRFRALPSYIIQVYTKIGGIQDNEARIMRNLKDVDEKGIGRSKEVGFVSFTSHQDALQALRCINNNPDIFTPNKRPIVAFSIENKAIVNLKQRRLQRSRSRNPLCSEWVADAAGGSDDKEPLVGATSDGNAAQAPKYTGIAAVAQGGSKKMRAKYKLNVQAELHSKVVRKEKVDRKRSRKGVLSRKRSAAKEPKILPDKSQKKKTNSEDHNFSELVNKYKTQMMSSTSRKKWYD